jgi:hypothetical protein
MYSIRRFSISWTNYSVKNFDFMQTISAENASLKDHGFRKIGSKIIDASKLVNQVALQADQSHYSYVPVRLEKSIYHDFCLKFR